MPIYDRLNFTSDVGKSVAGLIPSSTGVSSQGMSALSNALAGQGLSLDGIKNVVTLKSDEISPLGKELGRIGPGKLFSARSQGFNENNDPSSVIRNQSTESFQYPTDNLRTEFLTIDFSKYKRPSNFDKGKFESIMYAHLPIPRIITEQHTIDVAPSQLKTLGALVPIAENALREGVGEGRASREDYIEDAIGAAYSALAGYSGEAVGGIVGQYAGAIPNPHISVFFNGVDLRPAIEFSWMFTPKSQRDSEVLKYMLKRIKTLVLPTISRGNGNIMDYPHMVQITIHGLDPETTPIYKKGLITAININYTPNGPSFFKGSNAPTFIAFSFLMQEIEIITANDYGAETTDSAQRIASNAERLYGSLTSSLENLNKNSG